MGVGSSERSAAVRWGVAGNIVIAWVLTIPAAGISRPRCWLVLSPRPSLSHQETAWSDSIPKDEHFVDLIVADGENLRGRRTSSTRC